MSHKHRWQRLSDTRLFCEECAEVRVVAEEPVAPVVYPYDIYPTVTVGWHPTPYPYWTVWNTTPNTTSVSVLNTAGGIYS